MSRYRPPTPPGSKYITPEGAKRLQDELDQLWHEERPRVTQAVSEAAAQGDRSENAEYTYGKKRLHEIDRRVRFLRKRLEGMAIVDPVANFARRDPKRVYFGAWVQIESDRRRPALASGRRAGRIRYGWRLRQHGLALGTQPHGQGPRGRDHASSCREARPPSRWPPSAMALKPPECS